MLSKQKNKNTQKISQAEQFYEYQVKRQDKEEKTTAKEGQVHAKDLKKLSQPTATVAIKEQTKQQIPQPHQQQPQTAETMIPPVQTMLIKEPKLVARVQNLHKNPHRHIRSIWQIRQLPQSDTHVVIMPIHTMQQVPKTTKIALDFLKALRHLQVIDELPFQPCQKSVYFVKQLNCIQIDIISSGDPIDYQTWVRLTLQKLLNPSIFKQLSGNIVKMIRQLSQQKKQYSSLDELARQTAAIHLAPIISQNPQLLTKNIHDLVRPNIEYLVRKQVSQIQLVFKASYRNFCSKSFHDATDKLSNLLVIIESKSGQIFGGFSTESWAVPQNSIFGCNKHSNTFLFGNNAILRVKNKYEAIGCSVNNGPCFGLADIVIGNLNISNVCQFPLTYKPDNNGAVTSAIQLAGGKTFSLEQYEVYCVKFIN